MRGRGHLFGFVVGVLGCAASGRQVEYCEPLSSLNPVAEISCQSTSEANDFAERYLAPLIDEAGPLIVRVEFGADARVESLCVEMSNARDAWSARSRLSRRIDETRAFPAAPACFSGTRLDLNEFGAHRAGVQEARGNCRDHALRLWETRTAPDEYITRQADLCEEREQLRRGEIWLVGGSRFPTVSSRTPSSASRSKVLNACLDPRILGDPPPDDFAQRRNLIIACMQDHGWEYLY